MIAVVCLAASASAQCVQLTTGSPYTQNFNSLPTTGTANTWTDNSTIAGWYAAKGVTPNAIGTLFRAGNGNVNNGALYSFGTGTTTERALGSASSGGPGTLFYGVCLENPLASGVTVTQVTVAYTGEQWRNGGNTAQQTLAFSQRVQNSGDTIDLVGATYADVAALNFNTVVNTAAIAALDGDATANRTALTSAISVSLAPGQRLILRWLDINDGGNDHGVAVDDLNVSITQSSSVVLSLSANSPSVTEGNVGSTTNLGYTVSLTGGVAPAGGLTFTAQTLTSGTATAGTDFVVLPASTFTIPENGTSTTVNVTVNGDAVAELNETVVLQLSNPSSGVIGAATATGTIVNDDPISISMIQGSAAQSTFVGTGPVTTTGIVTYVTTNGYFIQTPDANVDGDPNTSEGIFVFTGTGGTKPSLAQNVQVNGPIVEFSSTTNTGSQSYDPSRLSITEFDSGSTFTVLSSGNPLPAPKVLTTADLNPGFLINDSTELAKVEALEKYEGMRVQVGDLRVVQSTDFTNVFFAVLNTYAGSPLREIGIPRNQFYPTVPGSLPVDAPRFDANQEVIAVDTDGNSGLTPLIAGVGQVIPGPITGVLDYGPHRHQILPDAPLTGPTTLLPIRPVRTRTSEEFTIASMNLEQFTTDSFLLSKIVNSLVSTVRTPDIIGLQEVVSDANLAALTTQLNTALGSVTPATGPYVRYFGVITDSGTIHNAFLVNTTRFTPTIAGGGSLPEVTFTAGGRAPLVLQGTVTLNGANYPLTVINNHIKSLIGSDYLTDNSDRAKRQSQAIDLANEVQTRVNNGQNVVLTGDWNSFLFNDGIVDFINTVAGKPSPCSQTLLCITDIWNHNLLYPAETFLPASERYSYVFRGDRQALDHILASPSLQSRLSGYSIAHTNAEYPPSIKATNATIRYSDHDHPVLYLKFPSASQANFVVSSSAASYNRSTQVYTVNLTIRNNGASAVTDTVNLVLRNLPAAVTVQNAAGTYQGAPYLFTNADIAANGGTVSVVLQYKVVGSVPLIYTPEVIVGSLFVEN